MSVSIDYTGGVFQANKAKSVGTITAGTGTYNLAVASYDSVSFSVASQEANPFGMFFKPDGTALYLCGTSGDDVNEYSLSSAWDISTMSFVQNFSVSSQETVPTCIFFKNDGTKMFIAGQGSDAINEYTLSTAWNVSTASYTQNFSISSQEAAVRGLFFKGDGTKIYVAGTSGDDVNEYNLSTAWDISTASFNQVSSSISSQVASVASLYFSPDGGYFYVTDDYNNDVSEYSLSTAWDVSAISYVQNFSVYSEGTNVTGLSFKSDGSKMYVLNRTNDTIYQYSTGTATSLDISSGTYFNYTPSVNTTFTFGNAPASGTAAGFALALTGGNAAAVYDIANASYDSVSFSVASQDGVPVGITFKPDGTSMFITGNGNDNVYQYTLSTAWDASTASYASKSFSVATQETAVSGSAFKPDGTLLYVCGSGTDSVFQYTLSTAWDISTASYASKSFSFSTQDNVVTGVAFNDDGTKMYISGSGNDTIFQYSLSTAWDISTASYASKSFSVSSIEGSPRQLNFSPTGNKLWFTGLDTGYVYELDLSTNFDISTASYNSVNFSTATQASSPTATFFKTDGTKMYVVGIATDTVYQYTTGSSATATFSYPASVEWPSGTAPTGPAIGQTDVLVFYTDDGGTTYQGFRAGDAMA